jgi:hypothetical protein
LPIPSRIDPSCAGDRRPPSLTRTSPLDLPALPQVVTTPNPSPKRDLTRMPRRTIAVDGKDWTVTTTGSVTQYTRDEFGLLFTHGEGPGRERRVMRFSPLGTRSPEAAFQELSEMQLRAYFTMSQPSWTSPETGYTR